MTSLIGQGGPPILPDELEANARVKIRSSSTEMARRAIRLIGSGVSFALVDDSINEEVEVTITTTGAPPTGNAGGVLDGTYPDPGLAASVAGNYLTETSDVLDVSDIDQDALATGHRLHISQSAFPSSPSAGDTFYDTDTDLLYIYNGADAWVCITPVSSRNDTADTISSTTYAAMPTAQSVSVQTGTKALVTLNARLAAATDTSLLLSFAVTGASTIAAADANSTFSNASTTGGSHTQRMAASVYLTTLTAGVNTFSLQARRGNANGTISERVLTVVGIP